MTPQQNGPRRLSRELIIAAALEACCVIGGIVAFLITSNWIWVAIGIVAGLGFSAPALIKYLRQRSEGQNAPR